MQSIAYLPASNGSANASLMTVTNIRAALASTIKVNTVANAPVKFAGTMGTPHTFTDPVTSETITIISEASAVDFFGSISGSDVVIDQIAPGYTDLGSKVGDIIVIKPITDGQNNLSNILGQAHNDNGSIKDAAVTYQPEAADHIQSGGIWSALTGFNAAMTALVGWQAGLRGVIAAVASRAFTASKDTYVDVLRTTTGYTTVFSLIYTEVANGAAAPSLAANSIRIAKVVTSGAAVTSILQTTSDTLGNIIYPVGVGSSANLQIPSKFHVYLNAAQNTSPGSYTVLACNAKVFDSKNEVDIVTNKGRFTATVPGFYFVSGGINLTVSGTTQVAVKVTKNGSSDVIIGNAMSTTAASSSIGSSWNVAGLVYLAAGDYIDLRVYCNGTVAIANGSMLSYFQGALLSAA